MADFLSTVFLFLKERLWRQFTPHPKKVAFIKMLKDQGMVQSMSRVHCCIDNGPMEGFWSFLKCGMYHYDKHYNTKEELIDEIDSWMHYYMYERYQRRFGVRTPMEVRTEALTTQTPKQYPIPLNKAIIKYKQTHYASLAA